MKERVIVIPLVPFEQGMEGKIIPYETFEDKGLLQKLLGEESQGNSSGSAGEGG